MNTEPGTTNQAQPEQPAPPMQPLPPPPAPQQQPVMSQAQPMRRSPGLALVLSFFPGLGHLYLGLYQRGIGVFLAFVTSIWFADQVDAFGVAVAFVWFFGVIDAYRQAHYLNTGQLGPQNLAGDENALRRRPAGLGFGVFLTALGLLLLYNQFYPIDFSFLYDWWPLILVGFGVWMIARYYLDQKKREEEAAKAREEEWNTSV